MRELCMNRGIVVGKQDNSSWWYTIYTHCLCFSHYLYSVSKNYSQNLLSFYTRFSNWFTSFLSLLQKPFPHFPQSLLLKRLSI